MLLKNLYFRAAVIITAMACVCVLIHHFWDLESEVGAMTYKDMMQLPKYDRPDLAAALNYRKTLDPRLGYPPVERMFKANDYMKSLQSTRSSRFTEVSDVEWVERGPNNFGGRTRAAFFDPNDLTSKKVWSGGVGGGLWYTNDITNANEEWVAVDDFFGNIAITALAFDPVNTDVFYFGTGEGWSSLDTFIKGNGIWKSVDGGDTWDHLTATIDNTDFERIQDIVVTDNSTVLASARNGGVMRSTDGGITWTAVIDDLRPADLEVVRGTIYASTGILTEGSVFKSTDDGVTWTDITPDGDWNRIEIGVHPNHPNTVYVVATESTEVTGFFKSSDQGETWEDVNIPLYTDTFCALTTVDFSRGQAWYDLIIAVSPLDKDILIVGGIDIYKSTDGGDTWSLISYWTGGCDEYVHADQHNFLFRPGFPDYAIATTDGGVYYTENFNNSVENGGPDFSARNNEYNVAQFYSCAIVNEVGGSYFLAGAQDNGSHRFLDIGVNSTTEVTGGDGAFVFIDQDEPEIGITSYVWNAYRFTKNSWDTYESVSIPDDTGEFINPADYNSNTNLLYTAGDENELNIFDVNNDPVDYTTLQIDINDQALSALTVSPYDDDVLFVGTSSAGVFKLTNIQSTPVVSDITPDEALGYLSSIEVGESEDQLLITYSNYGVESIFETLDGGISWSLKEGNLPDMPIRWSLYNPSDRSQVIVATELGVWITLDITEDSPTWEPINNGLANVRCEMLQIREADGLVAVATHGRGLYTSDLFATVASANFATEGIAYTGQPVSLTNGAIAADSYLWEFGDGSESTERSPNYSYTTSGVYDISLTVNDDASTTVTQSITVLPYLPSQYTLSDGGDFESNTDHFASFFTSNATPFELGSSSISGKSGTNSGSNAWVTGISDLTYSNDSESYLYTPMYDFFLSGDYTLSFYTNYEVESDWEGFIVEYTLDFGNTWNKLSDYIDEDSWYNQSAISTAVAFEGGEALFSGTTDNSWVEKSTTFSELSGNANVGFRFAFRTDPSIELAGIAIDDFTITEPTVTTPNLSFALGSSPCQGEAVSITNSSVGDLINYSWNFGDGAVPETSEGYGPHEVIYTTSGVKSIVLTAISDSEGEITLTEELQVNVTPDVSTALSETYIGVCEGIVPQLTVVGSEEGITYQLLDISSEDLVGEAILGTGEDLLLTGESLEAGDYEYRVVASNNGGCEATLYDLIEIEVDVVPVATITQTSTTTLEASLANSYQWFLDGEAIEGGTERELIITSIGSYTVEVTRGTCSNVSDEFVNADPLHVYEELALEFYPNPVTDILNVNFNETISNINIYIYDISGARVLTRFISSSNSLKLNVDGLNKGVYNLVIEAEGNTKNVRFVK